MNTFLPKGYEVPKAQSNYFKFEEGQNKFRIVSDAIFGYEYWNAGNKPGRLKEIPKVIPKDIRDDSAIKHFWAFAILDRWDNKIKILEITQSGIMRDITSLLENEDWGDPKGYDLNVNRTGKGLETKYTTQPSPHKPLTEEEQELVKNTKLNLQALFSGGNPFDEAVEIVEPEEDKIKLEDVPF